ncbi:MAG: M1 family aminopeptidase [Vicinamibacterales bacterium]
MSRLSMRSLSLASICLATTLEHGPCLAAQPADRDLFEPGVSQSLAEARAARVSDVHYRLLFRIPHTRSERITGHAIIDFALADTRAPLALDFSPSGTPVVTVTAVNGETSPTIFRNGHIVLQPSALRAGHNRVEVEFEAGDTPLNRNDDFLYTIFVPARAHEAFPVFDQPDLKARWTLSLEVPDGWATLANGAETARESVNGRTRVSFAETAPIASYLFAFAAGKFQIDTATRNGRTFRMFHRETDTQKVARNRDAIFDLHAAALDWMERYTAIPYPFGKFDFLLVPAFQFGGMEHPGAVFYNSAGLMLDESATQNQQLERASTISHETAHMWFGDLVTMRWFTDVWMKEVFANFMAAKIVNPSFPGINHALRFLHAHYPAAYDVDRTLGTNAIRQPLDNLKNAGALYGAIIYQKAPIVMRQLETLVGEVPFRDGLREYLRSYAFGNASWPDLISLLDAKSPDDLAAWSHAWVEEAGRPIVRTSLASANGRITSLTLTQSDPYPARGLNWTQDVQVTLGYDMAERAVPIRLHGQQTDLGAARGLPTPRYVLVNGGGRAYGELHLDRESLLWLSTHTPEITDALTRGSAWLTLWDAVLSGELKAATFFDLVLDALPKETDELNMQRVLGMLGQTFWIFISPEERATRAASMERVLRAQLGAADTVSRRSAYFSALRNVASTPDTVTWLTRVWRREVTVDGLPLAENDFIVLAEELVVREVPGWKALLDEQIVRTLNPDRKARLQFVAPALSADPAERDRFFASLSTLANRRREPWVLDGLHYLHHPLRSAKSVKYLRPSLDLLQDIQQTGDIFFPTRWMGTTLAGHRSVEAANIVWAFLREAGNNYPDRLRRTILTAGDDLFRASGVRSARPPQ